MKKSILNTLSLLFALTAFFACEKQTTPEPIRIQYPNEQSPIVRDNDYYARLRAYKQTKHPLAFGWYGSWTATASSAQSRLSSAPDSMDIISIWSQWHSLTKAQMNDKAFVQKTLGTKVIICILAKDVPEVFKEDGSITDKTLEDYARAFGKDSMDKYQYDGIDIDFETAPDHQGPLSSNPAKFKKFCEELSKYIGPKSGTGRLFLIDGSINYHLFSSDIPALCNYGVRQSYYTSDASSLEGDMNKTMERGWAKEQLIFTENFESYWKDGGHPSYVCSDGITRPSLVGMADFAKTKGSAGFGAYHMEYEYGHSDMPYKHMRRAIQLVNPAPAGDYTKNLVTLNETEDKYFTSLKLPSGYYAGDNVSATFTIKTGAVVTADTDLKLKVNNNLVEAYNNEYSSDYKAIDPSLVSFSAPLHILKGMNVSEAPVTASVPDLSSVDEGQYLIPICVDFSSAQGFSANTHKQVRYLIVDLQFAPQISVSLESSKLIHEAAVSYFADGEHVGKVSATLSASLSLGATKDFALTAVVDPALVEAYNTKNSTSYAAVAAKDVTTQKLNIAKGATTSSDATVSMSDLTKLPEGESMIAVRLEVPEGERTDYKLSGTQNVMYILITKTLLKGNVSTTLGDYETFSTHIANQDNALGWGFTVTGNNDPGDLKEFYADTTPNKIYNDGFSGWYTGYLVNSGNYWPEGAIITVDMKAARDIKTVVWIARQGIGGVSENIYAAKTISKVETSADGTAWKMENDADLAYEEVRKQGFVFSRPVNTRYIRISVKAGYFNKSTVKNQDFGMDKLELWAPKAN